MKKKNGDVDPQRSYADPDPQKLFDADPDPDLDQGLKSYLKSREIYFFQICTLILEISNFFSFRLEKYNFLQKNPNICGLNSAFPLIIYPWIRIHGPN